MNSIEKEFKALKEETKKFHDLNDHLKKELNTSDIPSKSSLCINKKLEGNKGRLSEKIKNFNIKVGSIYMINKLMQDNEDINKMLTFNENDRFLKWYDNVYVKDKINI